MEKNYCLGIESTAHTFGISILNYTSKEIIVNIKKVFTTEKGGLIPTEVAKHHNSIASELFKESIKLSKIKEEQLKFIAFSNAPGLAPCLLEGMRFAKHLAKSLDIPLVPVNHCIAHLEIGETTGAKDPVLLYASGANTQIISYEGGKYRIFGETLDLGVGNFIDTFARYSGLGFPGGPKIQEFALKGKKLVELPYSIKGMDLSFSGVLTKLQNLMITKKENLEDLSYSLQETVFSMLVESAERALAHTGKKELLLGGGVSCNSRLQEMCKVMCEQRGAKFFCPDRSLLVDNAGMIGFLGIKMYNAGVRYSPKDFEKIDIDPRERTDEVEVLWKK